MTYKFKNAHEWMDILMKKNDNKMNTISKHKIVYKVYEISEDGLLKEPTEYYYESRSTIFDRYDSQEEALKAIDEKGQWQEFIILPIAINYFE